MNYITERCPFGRTFTRERNLVLHAPIWKSLPLVLSVHVGLWSPASVPLGPVTGQISPRTAVSPARPPGHLVTRPAAGPTSSRRFRRSPPPAGAVSGAFVTRSSLVSLSAAILTSPLADWTDAAAPRGAAVRRIEVALGVCGCLFTSVKIVSFDYTMGIYLGSA